ncbi:hypothetical protein DCC81_21305 [Chitinophaga parva]|uniref:YD repeat-containing protein n=2 Tax=Chitinophaga parva TaxID=2169414 RepID=A0A2T7BD06_9BACT|nr:hypothetical protein DCC81_21305 [Chitinophaga parva]
MSNVIPPTPEAAAVGKYLDMPVGYATGAAEVSIPLHTLTQGDLSLPLTLSFNTGGIRVPEVPSWVGLGWSLGTGGSITRVVRGLPDDLAVQGYMNTPYKVSYLEGLSPQSNDYFNLIFNQAHNGTLDVEPDMYNYSVMGYSGTFYYDQDSAGFVQTPVTNVRIKATKAADSTVTGWVLTLPDGVKAYFGTSTDGRSGYDRYNSDYSSTKSSQGGYSLSPNKTTTPPHITTWQLMNIVSPGLEHIDFYYSTFSAVDFGMGGEVTDLIGLSGCTTVSNRVTYSSIYEQRLTKSRLSRISTEMEDVYFVPSTAARQDMVGDERALDSIVVRNKKSQLIEGVKFNTGYYSSPLISIPFQGGGEATAATKRLFLRSLTQFGANNISLPPYQFVYDTTHPLPSRLSNSQDYWGFYNGKTNSFLTPKPSTVDLAQGYSDFPNGGDRTVDINYAKAFSLSKIYYPTGGYTEYTYGSNISNRNNISGTQAGYQISPSAAAYHGFYFFYKDASYQQPGNPNLYVDSVTIGPGLIGSVAVALTGCTNYTVFNCPVKIVITGITDPTFNVWVKSATYSLTTPGKYKVTCTLNPNADVNNPDPDFSVQMTWTENPPGDTRNYIVGGLRVEKIVNGDANGKILSKVLKYNYFNDSTTSSGQLLNLPVHAFKTYCGSNTSSAGSQGAVLRMTSGSAVPLSGADGKIIRYENVTEYMADDTVAASKTEYTYSIDLYDVQNLAAEIYPFPTNTSRDWRNGTLEKKDMYVKTGPATYRLLRREQYFYNPYSYYFKTHGLKLSDYPGNADFLNMGINAFGVTPYSIFSERYLLDSTIITSYENSTMATKTVNRYNPQHGYTLAEQITTNSLSQTVSTKSWYAADYAAAAGANLPWMVQNNMVDIPVKQQVTVNSKLADGRVIAYNNYGQPANVYQYESNTLKDSIAHDPATLVPPDYTLRSTMTYAAAHPTRLTKQIGTGDARTTYIWDYNLNYLAAEVKNADSIDVAYTSFEADGTGYWTISSSARDSITTALTGSKSYSLASNISKAGLTTAKTYIVSYFTRNASPFTIAGTVTGYPVKGTTVNGWTYYEHRVTGVTSVSLIGTGMIDELRLYPADAAMQTYTYQPAVGISSVCDPKNQVTYYEYDGMNRLRVVRDAQRNILKVFTYKYADQPVSL